MTAMTILMTLTTLRNRWSLWPSRRQSLSRVMMSLCWGFASADLLNLPPLPHLKSWRAPTILQTWRMQKQDFQPRASLVYQRRTGQKTWKLLKTHENTNSNSIGSICWPPETQIYRRHAAQVLLWPMVIYSQSEKNKRLFPTSACPTCLTIRLTKID